MKRLKFATLFILCGFTFPTIWHLVLGYLILPKIHKDLGAILVVLGGYIISFIIMAGFEALGSSIYGWTLLKNVAQRTKLNLIIFCIGIIGFLFAILMLSLFIAYKRGY